MCAPNRILYGQAPDQPGSQEGIIESLVGSHAFGLHEKFLREMLKDFATCRGPGESFKIEEIQMLSCNDSYEYVDKEVQVDLLLGFKNIIYLN
tara:strand:+ start:520 stop:798 length:279 start_codon:yes stop_codon:yes gene_type:complete